MFFFKKNETIQLMVVFLLLLFSTVPLWSAGQSVEGADTSSQDERVVVFIRTGPEADGMRPVADQFTAETGIEVEFMEIGRSGYFSTMTTQLVAGTDAFDIVATNSAYVAQLGAAGALEPLNGYLDGVGPDYDADDILFTYGFEDATYAIPFDVSTHFLYYRRDLIAEPPQTWEEYAEVAEEFTRSINSGSSTQYGLAFTALPGPELPKVFYSVMWSMGGEIMDENGEVLIGISDSVSAANYYRSLVEAALLPPDVISWGFPVVLDALKTGTVAMAAPYWNAAYPQIVNSDSEFRNDIGIALVPGVRQADGSIRRTPFQHGWSFVINADSDRKDVAWRFLEYATSRQGLLTYSQNGGTPARRSVLSDAALQPREYFDLVLESLEIARDEPAVPYYLTLHDIMNNALTEVLTGTDEPSEIMATAAQSIEELQ